MRPDVPGQLAPGARPNGGHALPTARELRAACYAMIGIAEAETEPAVRRILAGEAFALAQQAQLQGWADGKKKESKV